MITSPFLSAAVGLASVGALSGFDVRSVDLTAPNSALITSPPLFQSLSGLSTGPSAEMIEASGPNGNLAYDSYVAIDTRPSFGGNPTVAGDGFQANPGDLLLSQDPFEWPGQVRGSWGMDPSSARPQVASVPQVVLGGADGVFLGRFTFRTTNGSDPTGEVLLGAGGITIEIRDPTTLNVGAPETDSLLLHFRSFGSYVQQGIDAGDQSIHGTECLYFLTRITSRAGPLSGGTSRWFVIDLYIYQFDPAPGSASLGLIVGSTFIRRRRPNTQGA